MSGKEQLISKVLAVVGEHRHEVEEPGITITHDYVDIPLREHRTVRIEFQRETIFIHGKGRLQYVEFFDLPEEICTDLGFVTGSFYSLVVPMVRKVIAIIEKSQKQSQGNDWKKVSDFAESLLAVVKPECEEQLAEHVIEAAYRTIYEIADGLTNIAVIQKGKS